MIIRNRFSYIVAFIAVSCIIQGAPIVQKVTNKSEIGFVVLFHNDASPCSLVSKTNNKENIIDAFGSFSNEFLLVREDSKKPSLILRPKYYFDTKTEKKFELLDEHKNFDMEKIEAAYTAWKLNGKKRVFQNAQAWLARWVGKDIVVVPDSTEIFGYLNHKTRARISNSIKEHGQWLSHAKGVFAHLILEIEVTQHDRKGIRPVIRVSSGEGGICLNGAVDRI